MGKVKKVTMDESQAAEVVEKKASKKKAMTIWEDLYTELTPRVAQALREARVKPQQLLTMPDGEITAIAGIDDSALEEIRSKYAADISAEPTKEVAVEEATEAIKAEVVGPRPANKRHLFKNGKAIRAAKSRVDRTKNYSVAEAVKLLKATNITKFDATVTVHLNLVGKEAPKRAELTFPHMAGAAKRVAIANDELLKDIDAGKIEFDILLTTPVFMPKLAKYAKVLGPKGLMPSPKAGTITQNPESKAKEFAAGKTVVKAEPKYPLMHITVGKIGQDETELVANIQALIDAVKTRNIGKAVLASTMSPGIKLQLV